MAIAGWLVAANAGGAALMALDKQRARHGGWRVRESTLIGWSLLGGSAGTLLAARLLRHKTRKQPIAALLTTVPVGQAIVAVLLFVRVETWHAVL